MEKILYSSSLIAAFIALSALVGCGGDTKPATDAGTDLGADAGFDMWFDSGPRCTDSGDLRTCQCPGGAGPAITLACAAYPDDDTCHTYTTTCVDDGFISCSTANFTAHPLLEARCRAYCAADGGIPDLTPCSGW